MKRILNVGMAMLVLAGCLDEDELGSGDDEAQTSAALTGRDLVRVIAIANGTSMSSVQSAPSSGATFGSWGPLGGHDLRKLGVDNNADGRVMLFTIGGDGQVYGRYQVQVGGGWNPDGWGLMGGVDVQQVVSARNADGRLELFARFGDGRAYHRWQVVPNGGWSPGWSLLGGTDLRELGLVLRGDGRLDLFAVGGDGLVYDQIQTTPNGYWPLIWNTVGGTNVTQLAVGRNIHNVVEVLALDAAGAVQDLGDGHQLGGNELGLQQVTLATSGDGRLELCAINVYGQVYTSTKQDMVGTWGSWQFVFGSAAVTHIAVANQANGRVVLLATAPDLNLPGVEAATEAATGFGFSSFQRLPLLDPSTTTVSDLVAITQPR